MNLKQRIEALGPWDRLFEVEKGVYTIPRELWGHKPNQLSYQHYLVRTLFPMLDMVMGDSVADMSALDVGCNCGWLSILLRRYGFKDIMGIDINRDFVEQARFLAETTGTEQAAFDNILLKDVEGTYDTVFMMGVINHANEPVAMFRDVYRLTNKYFVMDYNGFMEKNSRAIQKLAAECVDEKQSGSMHTRFKEGVSSDRENVYYFVYELSKQAVIHHLQHAGFYNIMTLESPVAMPKGYRKRENNVFIIAEKHPDPDYFKGEMALDTCYALPPEHYLDADDLFNVRQRAPRFSTGYYTKEVKTVFADQAYLKHVYACFAARNPGSPAYLWGTADEYETYKDSLGSLEIRALIDPAASDASEHADIPVLPPRMLQSLPPLPLLILSSDKQAAFHRIRTQFPEITCIP